VVIADDHPIMRDGLAGVIAAMPDFVLVGSAASGTEVVEACRTVSPDIVVMDLHMPDLDGIAATRQILASHPDVVVLVLTMYDDEAMLTAAVQAGARGYLVKGATHADIERALRATAAGDVVFGAGVAVAALTRLSDSAQAPLPLPDLTQREREILTLLARGYGTTRIASQLFLSAKTVRNHVSNILAKLDVPDRAQAIAAARQAGLDAATPPNGS
jgi:DNA-binding NarL/FixJ family response regulator